GTGRATRFFNQQRPLGPCMAGRTYVQEAQFPFWAHAVSHVFQPSVSKFLKSEPGRLILSSARRSPLEMNLRGPESQHASLTILGRLSLSQHTPLGPWIPGLTHV